MRYVLAAALLAGFMPPAPAAAQRATPPAAVRAVDCMLVVAVGGSQATDEKVKMALTISAAFYAGQAFGYDPAIDLKKVAVEEARRMTPARAREISTGCSEEMRKRGVEITEAGAAVSALKSETPKK
jgi:hypothetical protein